MRVATTSSVPPPVGGRQARWQPHNDRRREQIVAALIELLEESAPGDEVSTQQIAKQSGLARTA